MIIHSLIQLCYLVGWSNSIGIEGTGRFRARNISRSEYSLLVASRVPAGSGCQVLSSG